MAQKTRPHPLPVRLTAIILVIVLSTGLAEAIASFIYANRDSLFTSSIVGGLFLDENVLDPYEMPAEGLGLHWRLRPGYTADSQTHIARKKAAGKFLSLDPAGDAPGVLHINKAGFRGPELDASLACCRIMMLGDSVTFGLLAATYPNEAGKHLRGQGIRVETVNGGVEGYAIENLILELDRYTAFKPKTVTVMIGWNNLFKEQAIDETRGYSPKLIWLVRAALRGAKLLLQDTQERSRSLIDRPKVLDKSLIGKENLGNIGEGTIAKLATLVEKLREAGARVAIITLPGLYVDGIEPDARALSIGHLPAYTENPYFFAAITAKYNSELRTFAESHDLMLIDAAEWSRQALQPRSDYYLDAVHLTAEGLRRLGAFVASELIRYGAVPNS